MLPASAGLADDSLQVLMMLEDVEQGQRESYDHLADTSPMPAVDAPLPFWRRAVGLVSLLSALILTAATVALLLLPTQPPAVITPPTAGIDPTPLPTSVPGMTAAIPQPTSEAAPLPTLSGDYVSALLGRPLEQVPLEAGFAILRDEYDPFTFVPDRPRSEVIEYTVVSGDTMFSLAERFQVSAESIAWSNPRNILGNLRPGMTLNIPPSNGAVERIANDTTIAALAQKYNVDAFAIIDWESNGLFGATPDTILTSGVIVFIPGGTAEQISWTPRVERSPGGSNGSGGTISFAPGEPGSCGQQPNVGAIGGWTRPLSNYSWVRGFASWHTGVDLSAPVGTPVTAALGGNVIFRGWNSFGYGYTVVLAHGPFTSLYGHLSGFNVGCGQTVQPGQIIAFTGNSGNSSGPHLHFEVRYNDIPQDPTTILPF
jgi:murein DD-endopeptidase MepM/ murein hydrolase activator NlpD